MNSLNISSKFYEIAKNVIETGLANYNASTGANYTLFDFNFSDDNKNCINGKIVSPNLGSLTEVESETLEDCIYDEILNNFYNFQINIEDNIICITTYSIESNDYEE